MKKIIYLMLILYCQITFGEAIGKHAIALYFLQEQKVVYVFIDNTSQITIKDDKNNNNVFWKDSNATLPGIYIAKSTTVSFNGKKIENKNGDVYINNIPLKQNKYITIQKNGDIHWGEKIIDPNPKFLKKVY